jgi:DUF4097 and DUF4098 domain-containing protein YvlB
VGVKAQVGNGQLEVDGVTGPVEVETSSGLLKLTNLGGDVQAKASSGSIELRNVTGQVRASISNGQILGSGLTHVRDVTSSRGYISLEGVFTDAAQIRASSGTINIKFLPGSAVQLDAHTSNGTISVTGAGFPASAVSGNGRNAQRTLTGPIGSPAPDAKLTIETSNGSILLNQ